MIPMKEDPVGKPAFHEDDATVPDGAIKEAGRRLSQPDKIFSDPVRVEDPYATFESRG